MEQEGFYEEYEEEDEDSGDDEYAALEGALLGEGNQLGKNRLTLGL